MHPGQDDLHRKPALQGGAALYGRNCPPLLQQNQLTKVTDNAASSAYNNGFEFKDGADKETEYTCDENYNDFISK
jgi:hypothetical protein